MLWFVWCGVLFVVIALLVKVCCFSDLLMLFLGWVWVVSCWLWVWILLRVLDAWFLYLVV